MKLWYFVYSWITCSYIYIYIYIKFVISFLFHTAILTQNMLIDDVKLRVLFISINRHYRMVLENSNYFCSSFSAMKMRFKSCKSLYIGYSATFSRVMHKIFRLNFHCWCIIWKNEHSTREEWKSQRIYPCPVYETYRCTQSEYNNILCTNTY